MEPALSLMFNEVPIGPKTKGRSQLALRIQVPNILLRWSRSPSTASVLEPLA